MMLKAKILVVGPRECGKTVFSNFLADHSENIGGDYRPTQGVRILEFEVGDIRLQGRSSGAPSTVDVELWDCSGDTKFESCWPALAKDTNGVIFLYNPDQVNQDKDLEAWFAYMVPTTGIKPAHALAVSHTKPGLTSTNKIKLRKAFALQHGQHSYLANRCRLRDSQCLLVSNYQSQEDSTFSSAGSSNVTLPPVFAKMTNVKCNLEEDSESVRREFNSFLTSVVSAMSEKSEQEELNIMKQSAA